MTATVTVDGLSYRYRAGEWIISDLSCAFPAGAVTVVTGPSGRGKSTLLYLLGLILTPARGAISWFGETVSGLPDSDRARRRAADVGLVFQDAVLDPSRTVLDNVTEAGLYSGMSRTERNLRAVELLERFGVTERIDHRPGEVSGGQAQRVALCRALLTAPRLILADEPTGNLDHASADLVWRALAEAAGEGATVVVATHDLVRARAADRVLEL